MAVVSDSHDKACVLNERGGAGPRAPPIHIVEPSRCRRASRRVDFHEAESLAVLPALTDEYKPSSI